MGFIRALVSGIGKLAVVAVLLAAFLAAMAGVVYMSLSGEEIAVPEITGKDFFESEKELAALGLKIKKRADRPSTDRINTVLEQLPKAGETVKTGQLIFVVVSKAGLEGEETPKSLIKDLEIDDDVNKIANMIDDKPKKPKSNSNSSAKKKADTTRDVNGNESNSNSNSDSNDKGNSKTDEPGKKGTDPIKEPGEKGNKNTNPGQRSQAPPAKPSVKDPKTRNQPEP